MSIKPMFVRPKYMSNAKYFSARYGGKWKYDGESDWWCDDGIRHIGRRRGCDCVDAFCAHSQQYYLYGGKKTETVLWD